MRGIHDKILAEYGAADFNRRLHMYLQFPELRSEFILIDQNNRGVELPAGFPAPGFWPATRIIVLLGSAAVWFKKRLGLASA